MTNSSDYLKDLYNDIFEINNYFYENQKDGKTFIISKNVINNYCHYRDTSENGLCKNYFQMASSGVIHLLKNLKDKYNLDYDKLAQYAILWLIYKLNLKENNQVIDLNHFYTHYIVNNKDYNNKINGDGSLTYKDIIDKKKDLMDIKEISQFNDPFDTLLTLYYVIKQKYWNCTKYSNDANKFASKIEELNKDSNNKSDSYNKLLFTLSDDYKNLKEKCTNFPSLPIIEPKKGSPQNNVESPEEKSIEESEKVSGTDFGTDFGTDVGTDSGTDFGQTLVETPEGTSSSSSILNTVIPALSTFAIPVFLVVAYKVNNKELKTIIFKLYSLNTCKL
ncbi:hypothetical protein YYE_03989 [Plasmodium vinckei vinckei]|uniref:CIR protein PIR protein n=1 Tax=Plasmodium vinckei vinckei TaxID=54757 RepID=A0A081IB98_PLAVN|nr:hypothetical protein YYE_03989 [Plasmodium vinckei vinckei]